MPKGRFECCQRLSNSAEIIKCKTCKKKFHYACISTSKTPYTQVTEDFRNEWVCSVCLRRNKEDIIETIGGVMAHTATSDCDENVTIRCNETTNSNIDHTITTNVSMQEVRNIVREELQIVFEGFSKDMMKQFECKFQEMLNNMSAINTSIEFLEQKYEDVRQELSLKSEAIMNLERENKTLRADVSDLQSRLSLMELQSRACNVEVQCVPEFKNENLVAMLGQVASVIKCDIDNKDVISCTRVMKLNKDSPRPRSILVKFSSPRVRDTFLAASIDFNKKAKTNLDKLNTSHLGIGGDKKPVYICEHLTPAVKALHAEARLCSKKLGYRFVWVKNGRIFMRKSDKSDYIYIRNSEVLKGLK
ncbi:uncharacterized protein LOC123659904 [Melitaea cinxia]|uniref:uncharacterized protein LOC123659904 n=1 Tax=Melitaea cinxia TaxID=113334 RepID=UPI001E270612|nr:uncharacterized protein LOC123659904 [Melitaea cinxia]